MNGQGRFARLVGWFLGPIFYWLDWVGPDGRPSNGKVMAGISLFVMLGAIVWWGVHLSHHEGDGINWPFVVLCLATLAFALGKDVFKAFLKMKWGAHGPQGGTTTGGG